MNVVNIQKVSKKRLTKNVLDLVIEVGKMEKDIVHWQRRRKMKMVSNDPLKNPSQIYTPSFCKCELKDCELYGRSTLCYITNNHLTCELYESEKMVDDFLKRFRESDGLPQ